MVSKLLALESVITCVWYSGTKLPCLLPKTQSYPVYYYCLLSPERALLRHHIIGVRLLTSARRAKLPK